LHFPSPPLSPKRSADFFFFFLFFLWVHIRKSGFFIFVNNCFYIFVRAGPIWFSLSEMVPPVKCFARLPGLIDSCSSSFLHFLFFPPFPEFFLIPLCVLHTKGPPLGALSFCCPPRSFRCKPPLLKFFSFPPTTTLHRRFISSFLSPLPALFYFPSRRFLLNPQFPALLERSTPFPFFFFLPVPHTAL